MYVCMYGVTVSYMCYRIRLHRLHSSTQQQRNRIVLSCPVTTSDRNGHLRSAPGRNGHLYALSPDIDTNPTVVDSSCSSPNRHHSTTAAVLSTSSHRSTKNHRHPTNPVSCTSSVTQARLRCQIYHSFVNDCVACSPLAANNHFRSNGTIPTATSPLDENASFVRNENALNETRDDCCGGDVSSKMTSCVEDCPECLAECQVCTSHRSRVRYDLIGPTLAPSGEQNCHNL